MTWCGCDIPDLRKTQGRYSNGQRAAGLSGTFVSSDGRTLDGRDGYLKKYDELDQHWKPADSRGRFIEEHRSITAFQEVTPVQVLNDGTHSAPQHALWEAAPLLPKRPGPTAAQLSIERLNRHKHPPGEDGQNPRKRRRSPTAPSGTIPNQMRPLPNSQPGHPGFGFNWQGTAPAHSPQIDFNELPATPQAHGEVPIIAAQPSRASIITSPRPSAMTTGPSSQPPRPAATRSRAEATVGVISPTRQQGQPSVNTGARQTPITAAPSSPYGAPFGNWQEQVTLPPSSPPVDFGALR